jgi:hypothetical protein
VIALSPVTMVCWAATLSVIAAAAAWVVAMEKRRAVSRLPILVGKPSPLS